MKKTAFLLVAAGLLLQLHEPDRLNAAAAVLRQDLDILLSPDRAELTGRATLQVAPNGEKSLEVALSPSAVLQSATVGGQPIPFRFTRGNLSIPLNDDHSSVVVEIVYRAVFNDTVPREPAHAEDPGYGIRGTISPKGVFLSSSAGWYPYPYSDADRPTFLVTVRSPENMEAITSGKRLARGIKDGMRFSRWLIEYPVRGLALSAGPFEITEGESGLGEIPVYTYFYPENSTLSESYRSAAEEYLDLYVGLFGPYPFVKFAIVENFFPTGYGFPSWTLIGSTVLRLPFITKTSLGHEIAHSWWGNGVWADYSRGNWSEGLTTYVADYLYLERSSVQEAEDYQRKLLRDYATLVPAGQDYPLRNFSFRTSAADQAIGYGKSAMIFHMLRRLIGEEAFWGGLRQIAAEKLFQITSWEDFATYFGHSAGRDLSGFFNQWIDRQGAPTLKLGEVAHYKEADTWRVTGNLEQVSPYFDLHVPLILETAAEVHHILLKSSGPRTPFSFEISAPPLRLQADPNIDLFRRLDSSEIPPVVNSIRGSTNLIAVTAEGFTEQAAGPFRLLLAAMRQDEAPMMPEGKILPRDLMGRDVLFLGWPSAPEFQPPLPPGLQVGRDSFLLNGEMFSEENAVLFAALQHPSDPERTAAVFLPLSSEAGQQVARKIPHYGRYSYLVFSEGEIHSRDTWPITESPTLIRFDNREVSP